MLNDEKFIFWLNVFHCLMPHVDILYSQLQKRKIDSIEVKNAISRFEEKFKKRDKISIIFKMKCQVK
jgi:hypothetical protein